MFSSFDFAYPLDNSPLIPAHDQWPVFDTILTYSPDSSQASSPAASQDSLPSTAVLATMPIPPSRGSSRNKNPDHIPRPRNAFMLFRSAFAAAQKISSTIEHDNRHITRIIAHCWNRLSDAEKQVWRDKAATEKVQHAARYPHYRFSPVGRASRRTKRNVRRNGVEDVKRCEKLAELVMEGKFGQELEHAINKIDEARLVAVHVVDDSPKDSDVPPFRSPLLPPAETATVQVPEESEPQALSVAHVEPPAFYSGTDPNLDSLFQSPSHYQLMRPRSVVPLDFMEYVHIPAELEPSEPVQDFALYSWDESDGFSYYA